MRRSGVRSSSSPPITNPKQSSSIQRTGVTAGFLLPFVSITVYHCPSSIPFLVAVTMVLTAQTLNELPPISANNSEGDTMPMTDTAIRNAKPGDKPVKLSDERGLFLLISVAGGKWWRFKYRFDGKQKTLSLGCLS